jgi:long-chain acyl-CoA synthetase
MLRVDLENRSRAVEAALTEPRANGLELMPEVLAAAAAEFPHRPAVACDNESLSYAELLDRARRVAGGLDSLGLGPGDPIALLLPNGPAFVTAFFAIAELGAVVLPLNPHFKEAEIEFCFRESGVRGVIADPTRARVARRIASRLDRAIPVLTTGENQRDGIPLESLVDSHPAIELGASAPEGACVFQYSSGSTGRPKRVPRTHRQLTAEATALAHALGLGALDTILCVLPLSHSYGLGCCLAAAVRSGARLVVLGGGEPFAFKRRRALELIERESVTILPAVPLQIRLLAEMRGSADLSGLRYCFSAAAPLPLSTYQSFRRKFEVPARQLYGCTETGTLTVNLDLDPDATATSVGRPLEQVRVRIVSDTGAPLETGRIGEIIVTSPGMMDSYAGGGAVNRSAFRDTYFRTGDRGRLDDEGRLFITGRKKLLIDVKGDKVDPIEVEDVLAIHPRVREVAVVGVRTDVEGEELIKAVVVADGRCGQQELLRFCRERLSNYKVPHVVEFRDEIPRGSTGRILRKYLVD